MRRNAVLTVLAVLALPAAAASACSGGSAQTKADRVSPSSVAPAPTSSAASGPAPSSAASSSPVPAPTAAPARSGSACASSALRLALGGTNGGAGHDQLIFTLRNTSSGACTLTGYPSLTLLGDGGDPLPTHEVHGHAYSFPDTAPKPVTLAPGASASFDIDVSPVPTSGESRCPAATALSVTPPGASKALRVPVDIAPCGHGTVHVSPVVAGADGV